MSITPWTASHTNNNTAKRAAYTGKISINLVSYIRPPFKFQQLTNSIC